MDVFRDGGMYGWIDARMDRCTDGWMDARMDGWVHGRMDARTDGWTHARMDGCMHRWMHTRMDGYVAYGYIDAWLLDFSVLLGFSRQGQLRRQN